MRGPRKRLHLAGWSFFVALGTLGLAFFTWRAVRGAARQIELQATEVESVKDQTKALTSQSNAVTSQTAALTEQTKAVREQAEATKRQVEVSIASLEAASRPVLVGLVPAPGWRPTRPSDAMREMITLVFWDDHLAQVFPDQIYLQVTDEMIYASVPFRNVGAGVAFIQRVELITSRMDTSPLSGRVTDPIVPRDETTRALFGAVRKQSDGKPSEWEEIVGIPGRGFARFTIRATYTGASHELVTTTEVETSQLPKGGFLYTQQQVWDGEPVADRLLVSTDNIII